MFTGKKIALLPIYFISVFILISLFLISFYFFPSLLPLTGNLNNLKPWFPVFGIIITGFIGLLLVYMLWARRNSLKKKHGPLSYQKIFLVGFGGVIVMFSVVALSVFPIYLWIPHYWTDSLFTLFTFSVASNIPFMGSIISWICFIVGIVIYMIALVMVYRAINTFGLDYMAVVYLYFPEESEIQNHEIYSVLRHPTYAALIYLCLGGIFIHLNLYSVLHFLIFLMIMYIHVHFVEEKELIKRFGDSYKDFRNQVPAFFVHPKKWKIFFKFIVKKQ